MTEQKVVGHDLWPNREQELFEVRSFLVVLMAVCALLVACGGGGSPTQATVPQPVAPSPPEAVSLEGVVLLGEVARGYAQNATVCLDENGDLACGASELKTVTPASGRFTIVVPGAELSRLGSNRLVASLLFAPGVESVLLSRPYEAGTNRYVISPLTTQVEQLVLATMSRTQAVQTARELAGLQVLGVHDDYIAAHSGATMSEATSAGAAAETAFRVQSRAHMGMLQAPVQDYWEAAIADGFFLISSRSNDTRGSVSRGSFRQDLLSTDLASLSRFWSYSTSSGYATPIDAPSLLSERGPIVEEGEALTKVGVDQSLRRRESGRIFVVLGGRVRAVLLRSSEDVAGRPISRQWVDTTAVGDFPFAPFSAGAKTFSQSISVELSSRLETLGMVPRLDASGRALGANFGSLQELRDHYRTTNSVWLNADNTGLIGMRVAFGPSGTVFWRRVDPSSSESNPVVLEDYGLGSSSSSVFGGVEVLRLTPPDAARSQGARAIELAIVEGNLRFAQLIKRSGLQLANSRAVNRRAAEDILRALRWGVPPSGL